MRNIIRTLGKPNEERENKIFYTQKQVELFVVRQSITGKYELTEEGKKVRFSAFFLRTLRIRTFQFWKEKSKSKLHR